MTKSVHTIILDASPILNNTPTISSLLTKSEVLYTVPAIINEIKDVNARSRLETTILPFLKIKAPKSDSVKFVSDFARKTGDYTILSQPDIQILALAYELECEQNGGDWRLRKTPAQKGLNGPPPKKCDADSNGPNDVVQNPQPQAPKTMPPSTDDVSLGTENGAFGRSPSSDMTVKVDRISGDVESAQIVQSSQEHHAKAQPGEEDLEQIAQLTITEPGPNASGSDSEGWITPSNLKKRQAEDLNASMVPISDDEVMQVATITGDFAMQNVLLQIGLNLLSPSLRRVRNIKVYILRCHACFEKVKDTSKQFCPRCGKPTLTRVSCSTNQKGEFKIHLKKNMQWNHRGDRYSIPKPVPGSANGKIGQGRGGGKGGWGQELILAEDQKEYLRATGRNNGKKRTDFMSDDYLPGILTGDRGRAGGRPRIGAGRNVNSKKRS